jgi:hypothetical protein
MDEVWGEGLPPSSANLAPFTEIKTPTFFTPVTGVLLSGQMLYRALHYDHASGHSYPCPGPGRCEACGAGRPQFLTAWLACCGERTCYRFIMQLSAAAIEDVRGICARQPLLRGLILTTTRQDTRRNAKMRCEFIGRDNRDFLPEPFDVRAVLERIWGVAAARYLADERLGPPLTRAQKHQRKRGR